MNNPFGLMNLWMAGDAVTRFVAILLLVSSIITWVILISRLWNIKTLRALKPEAEQFWRASTFAQGLAGFSDQANNPYFQNCQRGDERIGAPSESNVQSP
jgi:biopolymer transport protein ExbB